MKNIIIKFFKRPKEFLYNGLYEWIVLFSLLTLLFTCKFFFLSNVNIIKYYLFHSMIISAIISYLIDNYVFDKLNYSKNLYISALQQIFMTFIATLIYYIIILILVYLLLFIKDSTLIEIININNKRWFKVF